MVDRWDEEDFRAAEADFQAKRRTRSALPHARTAIRRLLARKEFAQLGQRRELEEAWSAAVPDEFRNKARCGRLVRGVLEIVVADSLSLTELTFRKREILRRLAPPAYNVPIKDLRFRIGETE